MALLNSNSICRLKPILMIGFLWMLTGCSSKQITLHGVVLDVATQKPLAGKLVVVSMFEPSYVPMLMSSYRGISDTTTAGDGSFRFEIDVTDDFYVESKECGLIGGGSQEFNYDAVKTGQTIELTILHQSTQCRHATR